MAGPDIARGQVEIDLNDQAVARGLEKVEADFKAAAARVDRMKGEARFGADTRELDRALREAKLRVKELEGEKAELPIGANNKELNDKIREARREVKLLNGERATVEIHTRGDKEALANIERVRRAEAARTSAELRADQQRIKLIDQGVKARQREIDIARRAPLELAKQNQKVASLKQEWSKVTDEVEKADKAFRQAFPGTERKIKLGVELEASRAKMELVKRQLAFYGNHPPPKIKPEIDAGFLRSQAFRVRGLLANVFDKIGNVGKLRVFGNNLRTLGAITATLGPLVVSLVGSAGALVGVLGTGLAGAAVVAGGALGGLALNLVGAAGAVKASISDFQLAEKATEHYHQTVLKYGKDSKQAVAAQKQMNNVMKSLGPNMRMAATEGAKFHKTWRDLTKASAGKAVGEAITGWYRMLNRLAPTLAKNTNQTLKILGDGIANTTRQLSDRGHIRIFASLGKSANQFLVPAISAGRHLLDVMLHVGEAAARIFAGRAGQGLDKWAARLDAATQPGQKLDRTITRLGHHATDLIHLFAAFGRLMVTVFNGGANSGDKMINKLTALFNKWNTGLKTPKGQHDMQQFFERSRKNTEELFKTLGPLIGAFAQLSSVLAPVATGLLKGTTWMAHLINSIVKFLHLQGPLKALGITLGGLFVVGKIGAFASAVTRVAIGLREAYAAGKALGALRFITGGGAFGALRGKGDAAGIVTAHTEGAAAVRAAIVEGFAQGATGTRTAIISGSTTGAAEMRTGIVEGGAVAAREEAAGTAGGGLLGGAAAGGAAGGLRGLLTRITGGSLLKFAFTRALPLYIADLIAQKIIGSHNLDLSVNAGDPRPGHGDIRGGFHETMAQQRRELGDALKWWGLAVHDMGAKTVHGLIQSLNTFSGSANYAQFKARFDKTVELLSRSATGRKLLVDVALRGGPVIKRDFANLTKTLTGRNILFRIAALGGPHAKQLIAEVNRFPINKKTLRIVADSKTADEAIKRLEARRIRKKVLDLEVHGLSSSERAIQRLLHMKLGVKTLLLVGNAIDAFRKHGLVKALPNISRVLAMLGNHRGARAAFLAALGYSKREIHGILRMLGNSKNAEVVYHNLQRGIKDIHRHVIWTAEVRSIAPQVSNIFRTIGVSIGGHARGGELTSEEKHATRVVDKAAVLAESDALRPARSQSVNRPTFLVGEENRTEYVIATNPAYRKSNEIYLQKAAAELGYDVVPAQQGLMFGRRRRKRPFEPSLTLPGLDPRHPESSRSYADQFGSDVSQRTNATLWNGLSLQAFLHTKDDRYNIGYSDVNKDSILNIYQNFWGKFYSAEKAFLQSSRGRKKHPHGWKLQLDALNQQERANRSFWIAPFSASKQRWQLEEDDIVRLKASMDLAANSRTGQALYTKPGQQSKLWAFNDLKKERGRLIRKHRIQDSFWLNRYNNIYQNYKHNESFIYPKEVLKAVKNLVRQFQGGFTDRLNDELENAGLTLSIQPTEQDIDEPTLLSHYVARGYNAVDRAQRLKENLAIAQATPGLADDITAQTRLRDFYKGILSWTQGKAVSPAIGRLETLGRNYQAEAATRYREESDALSNLLGGQSAQAPYGPMVLDTERGQLYTNYGTNAVAGSRQLAATGQPQGFAQGGVFNPRTMMAQSIGPGISDPGGQFTTGGGQFATARSLASVRQGAATVYRRPAGSAGAAPVTHNRVMNVTNNFLTQPADPLTWSRGVQYDLMSG